MARLTAGRRRFASVAGAAQERRLHRRHRGRDRRQSILDAAASRSSPTPSEDLPDNRFNDGKVDRQGRFWAGTMDDRERQATGTLYRIDPDLQLPRDRRWLQGHQRAGVQPRWQHMYHNDSARQLTYRFDHAGRQALRPRATFLQFDARRRLSRWHDGRCRRLPVDCLLGWRLRPPLSRPTGDWLETVETPVSRPTSCAFGGPRSRSALHHLGQHRPR